MIKVIYSNAYTDDELVLARKFQFFPHLALEYIKENLNELSPGATRAQTLAKLTWKINHHNNEQNLGFAVRANGFSKPMVIAQNVGLVLMGHIGYMVKNATNTQLHKPHGKTENWKNLKCS